VGRYSKYINDDPSVTTIIDVLGKDWIVYWIKSKGFDFADQTRSDAAKIGQKVHRAIDKWLGGAALSEAVENLHVQEKRMFSVFTECITKLKIKPKEIEYEMYSKKLKVKGKADIFATLNGKKEEWVGDWKTDSWPKDKRQEQERITKYRYQLAAYALLWEEKTGKKINNGFIIRVTKEHLPRQKIYLFDGNDYEDLFSAKKSFKCLRNIYRDIKGN